MLARLTFAAAVALSRSLPALDCDCALLEASGYPGTCEFLERFESAGCLGTPGDSSNPKDYLEKINNAFYMYRAICVFRDEAESGASDNLSSSVSDMRDLLFGAGRPDFERKLEQAAEAHSAGFQQDARKGAPYYGFKFLDGLLPDKLVESVAAEVRSLDFCSKLKASALSAGTHMREGMGVKFVLSNARLVGPATQLLINFLESQVFVSFVGKLTSLPNLVTDPGRFGGGVQITEKGGRLRVHVDFNRHPEHPVGLHRRVNMLLFLNEDWQADYGGKVELWRGGSKRNAGDAEGGPPIPVHGKLATIGSWKASQLRCIARAVPSINRMLIFQATDYSYHGHPYPLSCPVGRARISVAMYYYTKERPRSEIANPAGRPGNSTLGLDLICKGPDDVRCYGSASVPQYMSLGEKGAVQNHLYMAETSAGREDVGPIGPACAQYERDAGFRDEILRGRYPWHPRVWRRETGRALYGTSYVQDAIWKHQHPSDCSSARFLAFEHGEWGPRYGMSTELHYIGRALSIAMDMGRVLVFLEQELNPGFGWYDAEHCEGTRAWECWFQELTHCAPHGDILTVSPREIRNRAWQGDDFVQDAVVPSMFTELLQSCSPIKQSMWFYWWRAQAVTYIMRFNTRTRHLIDQRRRVLLRARYRNDIESVETASIPPGTIAAHVRTATDKTTSANFGGKAEMQRQPLYRYLSVAGRLASGDMEIPVVHDEFAEGNSTFKYRTNKFARRSILINTEDDTVIKEAFQDDSWDVHYCLSNRTNEGLMERRRRVGVMHILLESWVNLELFLEADAWVCTLASAWCVLIDELRMTVASKAGSPFIDLMQVPGRYKAKGCPPGLPNCYSGW